MTATAEVDEKVRAIQGQVRQVVASIAEIAAVVERVDDTQTTISGVLAEQLTATRVILA